MIFLRTQNEADGKVDILKNMIKNGKIKYASVYAKTYNDVKNKLDIILLNQKNVKLKMCKIDILKDFCLEWLSIKKHYIKQSSYLKYYFN